MEIESIRPFLAIAISLIGAALIVVTRKNPNIREACSLGTAIIKFLIVASMVPSVLAGNTIHYTLLSFLPQFPIAFRVDALGILFAATASFLWILNTFYSIGYMRTLKEHAQTRYYACFAMTLSATMGVAFSANLITLYLFYELITFCTYPLVTHKETEEAFAGGHKYISYLLGTSKAFFLAAIILTFTLSGNIAFKPNGLFMHGISPTLLIIVFFLFLAGIGKAAIMPFHAWLPAAMVAPTPVSALLHAVAVVNTGVFCVLRVIFHIFGIKLMQELNLGIVTAFLASFTILMASIYALTRDNLKARLAYSTISQLSYIILGGALLTPSGMAGGVMHIVNHAFSKITLFFCAGSIYMASHKKNISEMGGIGRQMPWTMVAFSIGALSMIGVPPLSGFITKWYLGLGSIEAHQPLILVVLLASSLLNAAYFVPIIYKAFFDVPEGLLRLKPMSLGAAARGFDEKENHKEEQTIKEPSNFILIPLMLTAVISLMLGLFPDFLLTFVKEALK